MKANPTLPRISPLLPSDLAVLEPDVAGPLAVFPVVGSQVRQPFLSFAEGVAHGVVVKERRPASVNDLTVVNPLDVPVLLFEGEEVRGAQQDRTFDVTVLAPAGATLDVPVSCVEAGRWDGSRSAEPFVSGAAAAYPALRALKNERMRGAVAQGLEARADQHEVWNEVERKHEALGTASGTGAMRDVYEGRGERLAELEVAVSRRDGQLGAVVVLAGRPAVFDYVGRPDVFAALWQPLLRGYCLDAIEHDDGTAGAAPAPDAEAFLHGIGSAHARRHAAVGLGESITFVRPGLGGAGLVCDGELVQLSAFAADEATQRATRVLRPSRRR